MTKRQGRPAPVLSVTAPGEGELLRAGPVIHRVLNDGSAVGGRFAVFECQMPAGWSGPPQHIHREHDESFLILTGTVRFVCNQDVELTGPGALVTAPAGVPHTFGNGDRHKPATLICTVTPGHYFGYFREMQALSVGPDGLLDRHEILRLMARYATEPHMPTPSGAGPSTDDRT
jgi:mannose-6-phosphate isomerase-like protein (cupin superfamily)